MYADDTKFPRPGELRILSDASSYSVTLNLQTTEQLRDGFLAAWEKRQTLPVASRG